MGERSEYAPCNYILNHAENDDMHMYDTIGINDATPMEENLAYHVVRATPMEENPAYHVVRATQMEENPAYHAVHACNTDTNNIESETQYAEYI